LHAISGAKYAQVLPIMNVLHALKAMEFTKLHVIHKRKAVLRYFISIIKPENANNATIRALSAKGLPNMNA
jgi:hypothetical protein